MKGRDIAIYLGKLAVGLTLATLGWLSVPVRGAGSAPVSSEDTARHKIRMDDSQDLKDEIREALERKDGTAASKAARQLAELALVEKKYWAQTRIGPAIRIAEESLAESNRLAAVAGKPDATATNEALRRLEKTCRDCHDLHPEKLRDQLRR